MVLNLGQRWAREENKAANDLLDTALELSQISMLMYVCGEERGECTKGGKPGNGNISVWANLFLAFLLPSLSLFFFPPFLSWGMTHTCSALILPFPIRSTQSLWCHPSCSVLDPCITDICSSVRRIQMYRQMLWWRTSPSLSRDSWNPAVHLWHVDNALMALQVSEGFKLLGTLFHDSSLSLFSVRELVFVRTAGKTFTGWYEVLRLLTFQMQRSESFHLHLSLFHVYLLL